MESINWHTVFFYLFASLACGFALAVVFTSNIVRMAFYLILCLSAAAGLFFLAGADFVGAMQLVLYVGGTVVLLVFGVMLTSQGPFVSIRTHGGDWVLAALVGGSLLAVLLPMGLRLGASDANLVVGATSGETVESPAMAASQPTATRLGMALLGAPTGEGSGYLLPFEIISIHLLVVLVGAAYLARAKQRRKAATQPSPNVTPTPHS